jgi:hypothetical protein
VIIRRGKYEELFWTISSMRNVIRHAESNI